MKTRFKMIFIVFVTLNLMCSVPFSQAQTSTLKGEIYRNLGGSCESGKTLDQEQCYDAQMVKAYVNVLMQKKTTLEDIYFKVALKFSLNIILDREIRGRVKQRIVQDSKAPKPYLALENLNIYFGTIEKSQGRIGGQISIHNKGRSSLFIKQIRTSCPCLGATLKLEGENGGPGVVLPGQSAAIELVINLEDPHVPLGPFKETLTIESNDPYDPSLTVSIHAFVEQGTPRKKALPRLRRDRGFRVPSRFYSHPNL